MLLVLLWLSIWWHFALPIGSCFSLCFLLISICLFFSPFFLCFFNPYSIWECGGVSVHCTARPYAKLVINLASVSPQCKHGYGSRDAIIEVCVYTRIHFFVCFTSSTPLYIKSNQVERKFSWNIKVKPFPKPLWDWNALQILNCEMVI